MSEQKPQPPTGQYGTGKPPGDQPPGQPPSGQYPPGQSTYPPSEPPGQYPRPPGQYPSGDPGQNPPPPTGQYPPTQPPPGQYPPTPPPGQYPPTPPPTGQYPPPPPPPGQYPPPPPGQYPPTPPPTGQYPPPPPPGQYPPTPPPGQYPPTPPPTGQYPPPPPPGQYPPTPPSTGQYPPPPPGQYPPTPPSTGQYPSTPPGQYPPTPPPGQYPPTPPPTGQYPPTQPPPGQYPPPTKCPDPCDADQKWGPPKINPECCTDDRDCCPEPHAPCTWDEVDDACVRAASADCGYKSTKLSCKCEGSNADCKCGDWDCGFPDGMCAPCYPCEGLIPEDDPGNGGGGCDEPPPEGCSSEDLRKQQEANKKCISSKQTEKAKLEADIKARQDRDKELTALIASFDGIVDKYKAERHKLICREDCLKGFHRDTAKLFEDPQRFPAGCAELLQKAINEQLCIAEKAKCCQKNLEWKLEKQTRLIWEQKEAEKASKKGEDAFAQIKDLPKWMGDQFGDLEKLKDQIAQALNDKDPQRHKWAFYLFYWKFAPGLCKRFKVAICCGKKPDAGQPTTTPPATQPTTPAPPYGPLTTPPGIPPSTPPPAPTLVHIGCLPGDWHPSKISDEMLKKLICCAWEYAKTKKVELQEATAAVDTARQHLEFIKKKVEDEGKTFEDRLKARIEQVICGATSTR